MVDINNPANYKPCSKKSFEAYVCMPYYGAYAISSWVALKYKIPRRYYTQDISSRLHENLKKLVSTGEIQRTNQQYPFVLCDPIMQDYQVLAPLDLAQAFTFISDGYPEPMTQAGLNRRLVHQYLPWTLVRASQGSLFGKYAACFVPRNQSGWVFNGYTQMQEPFNVPGIPHGKGDFIVCPVINNAPNMNARYVVNGESFREMYNNKGWTDCLGAEPKRLHINDLPSPISPIITEVLAHCGSWDKVKLCGSCSASLRSYSRGGNDYDDSTLWFGVDGETGDVKWTHRDRYGRKSSGTCKPHEIKNLILSMDGCVLDDQPIRKDQNLGDTDDLW